MILFFPWLLYTNRLGTLVKGGFAFCVCVCVAVFDWFCVKSLGGRVDPVDPWDLCLLLSGVGVERMAACSPSTFSAWPEMLSMRLLTSPTCAKHTPIYVGLLDMTKQNNRWNQSAVYRFEELLHVKRALCWSICHVILLLLLRDINHTLGWRMKRPPVAPHSYLYINIWIDVFNHVDAI